MNQRTDKRGLSSDRGGSARRDRSARSFRPAIEPLEVRQMLSATLIEDINPLPAPGLAPDEPHVVGNTLYFSQTDGLHGRELWKSDGTAAGTAMVKDITPGAGSSSLHQFVDVGSILYFIQSGANNTPELWRSDGTEAGTVLVKQISAAPNTFVGNLRAFDGGLVFTVRYYSGAAGLLGAIQKTELWKSDGTSAGSAKFADDTSGPGWREPKSFVEVGGTLFFVAADSSYRTAIWKTDGTAAGTSSVMTVATNWLASSGGHLYFYVQGDANKTSGLWVSDGTESGTQLLKAGTVSQIVDVAGTLHFIAKNGAVEQLWRTDGTAAGTVQLTTFSDARSFNTLVVAGNTLYYTFSFPPGEVALWRSDAAGTQQVADISRAEASFLGITAVDDDIYFFIRLSQNSVQLWKSDGTPSGTHAVHDFAESLPHKGDFRIYLDNQVPNDGFDLNHTFIFTAGDGAGGTALWQSDGTDVGTHQVCGFSQLVSADSSPQSMTDVGGTVFFAANDGVHGVELWRTDGTAVGTALVKDITPGIDGSNIQSLISFRGDLFFVVVDPSNGVQLWTSDGTEAGTLLVKTVSGNSKYTAAELQVASGTLFFLVGDSKLNYWLYSAPPPSTDPVALWKSDGTADGTVRLHEFDVSVDATIWSAEAVVAGGAYYFKLASGYLWKSDGTAAGTVQLTGQSSDLPHLSVSHLTAFGGAVFFNGTGLPTVPEPLVVTASTIFILPSIKSDTKSGLWKTDGTAANTILVKEGASANEIVAVGGSLYFLIQDLSSSWYDIYPSTTNAELWRSDGTETGTEQLLKLTGSSSIGNLTDVGGKLFFVGTDAQHGQEIWTSDGTAAGTRIVNDSEPGSTGLFLSSLTNVGGILYFRSNDLDGNVRIWRSDGTEAGTQVVTDIVTGLPADSSLLSLSVWGSSQLDDLVESNGKLFFLVPDLPHGREPWVLPLAPSAWKNPTNPTDVNADGATTPTDAMLLIDSLNQFGSRTLPFDMPAGGPLRYLDVNGDGKVTPIDLLLVIDSLNRASSRAAAMRVSQLPAPDQAQAAAHAALADAALVDDLSLDPAATASVPAVANLNSTATLEKVRAVRWLKREAGDLDLESIRASV